MKQTTFERSLFGTCAAGTVLSLAVLAFAPGCDLGGTSDPGVGIQNVSQSAAPLPERNDVGRYSPYFATGEMNRPRYLHVLSQTAGGAPVAFGGSDERGFSGIDTVEIYDQSTTEKDQPEPESITGVWIDTNFEGDPITLLNGPRLLHTVNRLSSGSMIVIGGTADLLASTPTDQTEVFDPGTRAFETIEANMVQPRFRHATIQLHDGGVLLVAGQIQSTVTVEDPNVQPGQVGNQTQVTVFISVNESEVFSPTQNDYELLTISGTDQPSRLNTPRGRAGHDVQKIAGPDNTLFSPDDPLVVAGGFQTLSGEMAPQNKQPGAVARDEADGVTSIEFYDPQTRVFTQVGNVSLAQARINDPYIMNLGRFNDFTIDGIRGMGNLIQITHGNDDAAPDCQLIDEILAATYTGFGPSQGLQFFAVEDEQNFSHVQGVEYLPLDPLYVAARCATNPVPLPRAMVTVPGIPPRETWIFSLQGVYAAGGLFVFADGHPTIAAGCVFDPFYSLLAAQLGLPTRDLSVTRSRNNPTGVVGTWLTIDGPREGAFIPTTDLTGFGTTPPNQWAQAKAARRVFCKNIEVAGEDGLMFTADDRILLSGGGKSYAQTGGEPTVPSAAIFLPPGVNNTEPWP